MGELLRSALRFGEGWYGTGTGADAEEVTDVRRRLRELAPDARDAAPLALAPAAFLIPSGVPAAVPPPGRPLGGAAPTAASVVDDLGRLTEADSPPAPRRYRVPMTPNEDRELPAALAAALAVRLDRIGEDGVDFEPFEGFLTADETTDWFRAWTGNPELTGDDFRVFGQDGTGGYAAFWLARPGGALVEQPVVFLGSEGETDVVARNLAAFLWLLADGFGPLEAATSYEPEPDRVPHPDRELTAIAEDFALDHRAPAATVIAEAAREFPDFDDAVMSLCR